MFHNYLWFSLHLIFWAVCPDDPPPPTGFEWGFAILKLVWGHFGCVSLRSVEDSMRWMDSIIHLSYVLNLQWGTIVSPFWQWEVLHKHCWHDYDGSRLRHALIFCSLPCRYSAPPQVYLKFDIINHHCLNASGKALNVTYIHSYGTSPPLQF